MHIAMKGATKRSKIAPKFTVRKYVLSKFMRNISKYINSNVIYKLTCARV